MTLELYLWPANDSQSLFFCYSVLVHLLQDVIAEVKDVDPVVKLTFSCKTDFLSDDQKFTCITMISKQKQWAVLRYIFYAVQRNM